MWGQHVRGGNGLDGLDGTMTEVPTAAGQPGLPLKSAGLFFLSTTTASSVPLLFHPPPSSGVITFILTNFIGDHLRNIPGFLRAKPYISG